MAQAPQRFYTRFGGDGDDIAYSGKPTNDGQYIIAGSTSSYGSNGNTDMYLVKVDSMGFPMWQKFFGGTGNDIARSVIQLPDSGFMMAGYTNSFGAGGYDVLIVKTDKNGNKLWQNTYGGGDWDFAYDLIRGPDANFYIVGNTSSFGSGKKDGYLLKIDSIGNVIDQKFYGGVEDDELKSIISTNDNKLATVGFTKSKGELNGDGYFLKLELNGDTIFTRTFGGPYLDYALDLIQKGQSQNYDFYLCGAKTYSINAETRSYVQRYTELGVFIADTNDFRNNSNREFVSITNSQELPYISGLAHTIDMGYPALQEEVFEIYPDLHEGRINDSGDTGNEIIYSIEGTGDGGYLSVGSTDGYNSLGKDIYLIKRDTSVFTYESVVGLSENKKTQHKFNYNLKYNDGNAYLSFTNNSKKLIQVFDLQGNLIVRINTNELECFFSKSLFRKGVYLLKIDETDGKVYFDKLLIN